jgi:hypothetical protein
MTIGCPPTDQHTDNAQQSAFTVALSIIIEPFAPVGGMST